MMRKKKNSTKQSTGRLLDIRGTKTSLENYAADMRSICHAVYKSKRETNQLITYQNHSNYANVCLKHNAMFQQIDLSLKAVNNSIVRLNWTLNENEKTASFIS